MPELNCTCRPGESVAGTKQEIIEQRLAPLFGITADGVHVMLDLLDRSLEASFEEFPDGGPDWDTERRMAAELGCTQEWVRNFLASWEFISNEVDREWCARHK